MRTIKWRLRQVMADRRMTNKALGAAVGIHYGSISRLKAMDVMPRIDGASLGKLCDALSCDLSELIVLVTDPHKGVA